MKPRSLLVLAVVLLGTAVCVRLGFWQLSRWHEKKALNQALRAAAAVPPARIGATVPPLDAVRGRYVEVAGRFDEARQVLLGGRPQGGSPGIEVVTPLVLEGDTAAVLVNRGWLYSADAATARPQDYPEPGPQRVVGYAEPLRAGARGPALVVLEADSVTLYSARWLDLDTLSSRLRYQLAPFAVRQSPGPAAPAKPARLDPRALNEAMHLSYAVQWFFFAAILLGGSAILARSRKPGRRAASEAGPS